MTSDLQHDGTEFSTDLRSHRSAGADWGQAWDQALSEADTVYVPPGIFQTNQVLRVPHGKGYRGEGRVVGDVSSGSIMQCGPSFVDSTGDVGGDGGPQALVRHESQVRGRGVLFDGNSKPDITMYTTGIQVRLQGIGAIGPKGTGSFKTAHKVGIGLLPPLGSDSAPSGSQLFMDGFEFKSGTTGLWVSVQAQDVKATGPNLVTGNAGPAALIEAGSGQYAMLRAQASGTGQPMKITGNENEFGLLFCDGGNQHRLIIAGPNNKIYQFKAHGTALDFTQDAIFVDGTVDCGETLIGKMVVLTVGTNQAGICNLDATGKLLTRVSGSALTGVGTGAGGQAAVLVRAAASGGTADLVTYLDAASTSVWTLHDAGDANASNKEYAWRGCLYGIEFGAGAWQTDNARRTEFSGNVTHCKLPWNIRPGIVGIVSQYSHMVP